MPTLRSGGHSSPSLKPRGFLADFIENNRAVFPQEWTHIVSALKEAQFFKLFVPVEYGGQKPSEQEIYFMMELLGYASPGLGIIFVSHERAIDFILSGTKQQKEEYLPKMAEGNFGAIAMTEEKAGSDASAVGLRAERVGDHYLFNGKKIFISNSGLARDYAILANTKGIPGPRSLSVFIVGNDFPGLTISCGLARPRSLVGEKPTQVTVSHGPGIQPCRCSGNRMLDA
jgi:alkylation response protein AidB-like acyl-CoA dehydrogenase